MVPIMAYHSLVFITLTFNTFCIKNVNNSSIHQSPEVSIQFPVARNLTVYFTYIQLSGDQRVITVNDRIKLSTLTLT